MRNTMQDHLMYFSKHFNNADLSRREVKNTSDDREKSKIWEISIDTQVLQQHCYIRKTSKKSYIHTTTLFSAHTHAHTHIWVTLFKYQSSVTKGEINCNKQFLCQSYKLMSHTIPYFNTDTEEDTF